MNNIETAMAAYMQVIELSKKVTGFNLPEEVQLRIVQADSAATLGDTSKAAKFVTEATNILRPVLRAFIRKSPVHFARVIQELQVGEDMMGRVKTVLAKYEMVMPAADTLETEVKLYVWMYSSIELTKTEAAKRRCDAEAKRQREVIAAEIERRRAEVAPWHRELAKIRAREAAAAVAETAPSPSVPAKPVLDLDGLTRRWSAKVTTTAA